MGKDNQGRPAGRFAVWAAAAALAIGAGALVTRAGAPESEAYRQEIQTWQKQRLDRLKSDEGWLVVSGLTWLKDGANPFGSDPANTLVLPAHSVPPRAGVLHLEKGTVSVELAPQTRAVLRVGSETEDRPLSGKTTLRPDVPGPYDVVGIGDVRFFVIERQGKMGIRVRDLRSPRRAEFKGLEYFPISSRFRVNAQFVPHARPTKIKVPNILGYVEDMTSPGQLRFRLGDQQLALDAVLEADDDQRLFVIFKDTTAGKLTYPSGRFVYTDQLPKDQKVVLDFNKAYTPPCAFTAFATCPLPPPQNRLRVAIEAGEKFSGH
jgi:uncharacterized protein